MDETRRDFLRNTSLAAIGAVGAQIGLSQNGLRNQQLFANQPQSSSSNSADSDSLPAGQFQLGLVTYQWGKDWTVAEIISHCTAAKFSGVELRSTHKHGVEISLSPAERLQVKNQFADSAVAVVGLGSACEYHATDASVVEKNIEETKEFVLLSRDIGGSGVKVRPNGLPKEVPVEKTVEQIGLSLRRCAQFAADHGQEIRLEVHGSGTSNIQIVHQIMEIADHSAARVCWNCNPQDLDAPGFQENFELLADRISIVHIHDLTIHDYPWVELFRGLRKHEFKGWTLVEDGRKPDSIPAALHANQKEWQRLSTENI